MFSGETIGRSPRGGEVCSILRQQNHRIRHREFGRCATVREQFTLKEKTRIKEIPVGGN